ncbi:DNA methyltransferase [Vibrio owensii]|uniref:DNA methyltransferase n=1 Tax=Vibrio harveyi group TaxID=717610 RepID=UPI003CC6039C
MVQADLFEAIEEAYIENDGKLSQGKLYENVAQKMNVDPDKHYGRVGKQDGVNLFYRKVRWCQQSMKAKKLLVNVGRGVWELAGTARQKLHQIKQAKSVIAMSTSLGVVICSKSEQVFGNDIITEDIDLVLTSPPYLLREARAYGGPQAEREWVDFIMGVMTKIIPRLSDGASIALNVGVDSFIQGMPARHTHIERLVIAMTDLDLYLVDRIVWGSNKAPGPYMWTSENRFLMTNSYEFVLWFTNNPLKLQSNNQRILVPHTEQHKKFVLSGGTKKAAVNSDGAHRKRPGAYSNTDLSKGKLQTNYLYVGNRCVRNEKVNKYARENGLPVHGAKFPYKLAEKLVRFFVPEGAFVVDPFGGTATVGEACEENNRRFAIIEPIFEYVKQSFVRFRTLTDDIWINPLFA